MNRILQKSLAVFLLVTIVVSGISVLGIPQRVQASFHGALTDCISASLIGGAIGSVFSIFSFSPGTSSGSGSNEVPVFDDDNDEKLQEANIKEEMIDCLVWWAKQSIIQTITGNAVGWINTGFGGDAFFVRDPSQFYSDVEDRVTNLFIANELRGAPIPSVFKAQIINELVNNRTRVSINSVFTCNEPLTSNILLDPNPDSGWGRLFDATTNPACTPQGAYNIAQNQLDREIAIISNELAGLVSQGDGFLPEFDGTGRIITPGKVIESQLEELLSVLGVQEIAKADEISELTTLFTSGGGLGLDDILGSGSLCNSPFGGRSCP